VPELQQLTIPWAYLGIMTAFFFPAYVLLAAVMVAVGSSVTELQQGQQVAGIMNIFFMLPLFLTALIFENPSAPILRFFTFFPTTSFLMISLRWGVGTVPLWQIGLSWVILVGSAVFMAWAAVRIFHVGMLRYGQPLKLKTAVAVISGRSPLVNRRQRHA
jgi:ABC-2 type transport system permease protein